MIDPLSRANFAFSSGPEDSSELTDGEKAGRQRKAQFHAQLRRDIRKLKAMTVRTPAEEKLLIDLMNMLDLLPEIRFVAVEELGEVAGSQAAYFPSENEIRYIEPANTITLIHEMDHAMVFNRSASDQTIEIKLDVGSEQTFKIHLFHHAAAYWGLPCSATQKLKDTLLSLEVSAFQSMARYLSFRLSIRYFPNTGEAYDIDESQVRHSGHLSIDDLAEDNSGLVLSSGIHLILPDEKDSQADMPTKAMAETLLESINSKKNPDNILLARSVVKKILPFMQNDIVGANIDLLASRSTSLMHVLLWYWGLGWKDTDDSAGQSIQKIYSEQHQNFVGPIYMGPTCKKTVDQPAQ